MSIVVWLLCGCESWTINADSQRKLEAFEMWCYRRLLKISWTRHVTNENVLKMANDKRRLLENIRKRQIEFIGHISRHQCLEKLVLEGKIEGKRSRGRQRMSYLDSLRPVTHCNATTEILQMAQDRQEFRDMVAHVRIWHGTTRRRYDLGIVCVKFKEKVKVNNAAI